MKYEVLKMATTSVVTAGAVGIRASEELTRLLQASSKESVEISKIDAKIAAKEKELANEIETLKAQPTDKATEEKNLKRDYEIRLKNIESEERNTIENEKQRLETAEIVADNNHKGILDGIADERASLDAQYQKAIRALQRKEEESKTDLQLNKKKIEQERKNFSQIEDASKRKAELEKQKALKDYERGVSLLNNAGKMLELNVKKLTAQYEDLISQLKIEKSGLVARTKNVDGERQVWTNLLSYMERVKAVQPAPQ